MRHGLTTTIDIEAPPGAVWNELIGLIRYGDWNPFIRSASGCIVPGQRLELRMQPPGGRAMTFRPTVTIVEKSSVFEWLGALGVRGLFDGRHRFELRETAEGTRLVQSETFSGILVRLFGRSLDDKTKKGFELMNAALRDRFLDRRRSAA